LRPVEVALRRVVCDAEGVGQNSHIQWTHHTFNPWVGCARVSPGCVNCYAALETYPRVQRANGRELWGVAADRHVTADANWRKPLGWNRAAAAAGERHRVFCASMADVFEDRPDLAAPRERLWTLIETCTALDWLLLTKRPEHIARMVPPRWLEHWPAHVWPGTTVEDQRRANERLPHLTSLPSAQKFVSAEPLLERVDISRWLRSRTAARPCTDAVTWVITGGESGTSARPCADEWLESIVEQCRAAGRAPFVKQLGARAGLRHRKGGDIGEFPASLQVREFPTQP
jgi:protein gp37